MDITKPEVDYPEGTPPKSLEITDIWEGDGKVAGPGDTVDVHYVGVAFSSGEEFDASTPFLYFCDLGPELAAAVNTLVKPALMTLIAGLRASIHVWVSLLLALAGGAVVALIWR